VESQETTSFRNADPLARFVIDRLDWTPLQFGIAILIANIALHVSTAWYFEAFVTKSGPPGLLQDPAALFIGYVMQPLINGFYIWTIKVIEPLFRKLRESTVFTDESSFNKEVQDLQLRLRSKVALGASVSVAAIVTLLLIGTFLDWYPWARGVGYLNHSTILPWLAAPVWFLTTYTFSFSLFNIAVTIAALRRLFKDQSIQISPWHPDKCGGLKSISQYSLTLGYPIAVIGAMFSIVTIVEMQAGVFTTSYLNWIAIVSYIILAPVVFFLPLKTPHEAMREAKESSLMFLAKQFDDEYSMISGDEDGIELEAKVKKIEQLRRLYEITEEFPIWPFDVTNLRRFFAVTGAAIIPALISLALDLVRSLF
jgi:hypothetical protein